MSVLPYMDSIQSTYNKWIRIDTDIFDVIELTVQLSLGTHATIYASFDIANNPGYLNNFIKRYENLSLESASSYKFDIYTSKFVGIGSFITSIDIDFDNRLNLNIRCDVLNTTNIQDRRDELLDDILNNETLINKNNIK